MKDQNAQAARRRLEGKVPDPRGAQRRLDIAKPTELRDVLRRLEAGQRELFRRSFDTTPLRATVWTEWTPTLIATTTNPTLGATGAATGWYRELNGIVWFHVNVLFGGAGVAGGTGNYRITGWPVAPIAGRITFGAGDVRLTSGATGQVVHCKAILNDVPEMNMRYPATYPAGVDTQVSATAPWAWGVAGDRIEVDGWYPTS